MADTIREQIIKAIIAKLARVKKSSLFATDCGSNVHREQKRLNPDKDLDCWDVFPGPEVATPGHNFVTCVMDIAVEGHVVFGDVDPSIVKEQILGDAIKIMTDRRTIDDTTAGLAESVEYKDGGGSASAEAGDVSIGVSTVFKIKYRYKTGDPFISLKKTQGESL